MFNLISVLIMNTLLIYYSLCHRFRKTFLFMRSFILLMLVSTLNLSAIGIGQNSFEANNMPVRDVSGIDQMLILPSGYAGPGYSEVENDPLVVAPVKDLQQNVVTGKVTDALTGQAMPGVGY